MEFSDDGVGGFRETDGANHRPFTGIAQILMRRLHAAGDPPDLGIPPGDRPEALQGDREGQRSMRINDQHRIRFTWTDNGPAGVASEDRH